MTADWTVSLEVTTPPIKCNMLSYNNKWEKKSDETSETKSYLFTKKYFQQLLFWWVQEKWQDTAAFNFLGHEGNKSRAHNGWQNMHKLLVVTRRSLMLHVFTEKRYNTKFTALLTLNISCNWINIIVSSYIVQHTISTLLK